MTRTGAACAFVLTLSCAAAADPSLECSVDAGSQVEIAKCLSGVEMAAEKALEVALRFAREKARDLDAVTERDVALPALDQAQSSWLAYRDAECAYAGALFGGGSGTGVEIRSCRISLTRDRTDALFARLY